MATYSYKEITNKSLWERFVVQQKPQSFLQSWNWGETHTVYGEDVWRLGFYKNKTLVGVCLLIGQKAKRGPHLLVPGGPLIDWNDEALVSFALKSIKSVARDYGAWFVRVRPELLDSSQNKELMKTHGFIKAPMHLNAENTWVLDVTPSEEDILAGMRKNTRYLVRKSLKSDLSFTKESNEKGISILHQLQIDTVSRNKFVGFPKSFFEGQISSFGDDNQADLFVVSKGNKKLAAAIIIYYGDYAYYHHSGSSNEMRDIPSSYFLQWNVIKEAKKRKLKGYNFWGIAPEGENNHRFSGVTTFKRGFGGERIDWVHAHDLPINPLYWTTYVFETMRRILRGL